MMAIRTPTVHNDCHASVRSVMRVHASVHPHLIGKQYLSKRKWNAKYFAEVPQAGVESSGSERNPERKWESLPDRTKHVRHRKESSKLQKNKFPSCKKKEKSERRKPAAKRSRAAAAAAAAAAEAGAAEAEAESAAAAGSSSGGSSSSSSSRERSKRMTEQR